MKAFLKKLTAATGLVLALATSSGTLLAEDIEVTHDGLVRMGDSQTDLAYMLPEADFSIYDKVMILEPSIAFKKNWLSNANSGRSLNRITNRDMEQMIADGKMLLFYAFSEVLEENGYSVVKEVGDNVLTIRPMIINLDVAAPDPNNMASISTRTYTRSAGEATLFIELYDSVTGQILARAFDSQGNRYGKGNGSGRIQRTKNTNRNDAKRAFHKWANMLVAALDRAREIDDEEKDKE